jgi:PEP-CTERM motif
MKRSPKLITLAVVAGLAIPATLVQASSILFIGNDGATPGVFTPTDTAMIARLGALGHTVTAVDDGDPTGPAQAVGKPLIVISNTTSSATIASIWGTTPGTDNDGALLRAFSGNILNFQGGNGVVVNLGLLTTPLPFGGGNGSFAGGDLNILMPAHPLAAGLSGTSVPVVSAAATFASFGTESGPTLGRTIISSADVIATFSALGHNAGAIVDLEPGDLLGTPAVVDPDQVATAPGRRVSMFLEKTTFDVLNADGLKLFDAAVGYAVPEPSTWALATLGMLGLATLRFVRRS